jgi:hypothetical protein
MPKDIDIKQEIESSLAAVQRLRDRRTALVEEIQQIDRSLAGIQDEIAEILNGKRVPSSAAQAFVVKPLDKKVARKEAELTVNEAVLQVILDAGQDISKSDIRIRAMKLAGPFSESALNAALAYWVEEKHIENTTRGFYSPA